jgi:anti-sigma factor ChrR (cupin superfamily)
MSGYSVKIHELEWVIRDDGVSQATIYEEGGFVFSLVRIPPHTTLPKHWHPENEYVFIQEGILYEEGHPVGAGTFLLNEKGSCHSTSTRDQACTLLALWCGRLDYEGPAE